MPEIDQAIEQLELFADCEDYYRKNFKIQLPPDLLFPALQLAIQALEEKAERDKYNLVLTAMKKRFGNCTCQTCQDGRALLNELTRLHNVAAEYGVDIDTMLTLAKSQIKTISDNAQLWEENERLKAENKTIYRALAVFCGIELINKITGFVIENREADCQE